MFEKISNLTLFVLGFYSVILGVFTNKRVWMSIWDDVENTSFALYYNKLTNIVLGLMAMAIAYGLLKK